MGVNRLSVFYGTKNVHTKADIQSVVGTFKTVNGRVLHHTHINTLTLKTWTNSLHEKCNQIGKFCHKIQNTSYNYLITFTSKQIWLILGIFSYCADSAVVVLYITCFSFAQNYLSTLTEATSNTFGSHQGIAKHADE